MSVWGQPGVMGPESEDVPSLPGLISVCVAGRSLFFQAGILIPWAHQASSLQLSPLLYPEGKNLSK
jgi:hypothetical protein